MRARKLLLWGTGAVAVLCAVVFGGLQTVPCQRGLAAVLSSVASTPERRVDIDGITGFFPTDLRLARIELADRNGPWLSVSEAHVRWSFASLLQGRLRIETASAATIDVLRAPAPAKSDRPSVDGGPLHLPFGVDLQALSVDDLHLAAALAGVDSRWRLAGSAFLPADLAEGRVRLTGDRTDGRAGHLAADIRFDAGQRTVDGEIALDEGQGGVMSALLERPELERTGLRLAVRGDATAGSAELTLSAGDAATATGKATWKPQGAARVVSVRLDTAGPGLPPGPLADAARGPSALVIEAVVDEKLMTLTEARLTAGPLSLTASGTYDRVGDRLQLKAALDAAQPGSFAPLLNGIGWRGLHLQATADLRGLAMQPTGSIVLEGGAEDFALQGLDPRLPSPGKTTLVSRLALRDGAVVVESFNLGAPLASVTGSGTYGIATRAGDAKATLTVPSVAPLSAFAEQPLTGRVAIDFTARSEAGDVTLGWQGTLSDFGVPGMPQDLVAPGVSLAGSAALGHDEAWSLSGLRIASAGGVLTVSGRGRGPAGTLDLALDVPKLGVLQPGLDGAVTANATVGFGEKAELELKAETRGLMHGQLTSRRLSLAVKTTIENSGALRGTVDANGDLAGEPLTLSGRFARDAVGGVTVPALQGNWASAVLDIADFAVAEARTSGHARLRIAHLQELSALAGTALSGTLDAEVTADPASSVGRLDIKVQGTDLQGNGVAIGALDFAGTIDDPAGSATTDATLKTRRVTGAAGMNGLSGTFKGDRKGLDIALQATGVGTNGTVAAKIVLAGQQIGITLSRLDGRHQGIPIALAAPARVTIQGARVAIEPATLRLGGGRLAVRGAVDPVASDLQLELAALPLALIDSFAPGTGLDGVLQAKMRVQGAIAEPRIDATYTAANLRLRRKDAALLPALSLQGTGTLVGRRATVDAQLGAGGATRLALKATANLPRGGAPLSANATLSGMIDAAPFGPLLGNDVRSIAGTLRPDLTLVIQGERITGTGSVELAGGAVALPESGLRLSGGTGRLVLAGETLQVQRLAFQTGRNGSVSVTGSVRLDAAQGVGIDLAIASRSALLVNRPDLVATVSSDLKITGSTASGIDIAGPVTIDHADIAIGAGQSVDYPVLEVREINKPGGDPQAAVVPPPQAQGQKRRPPPSPTATPLRLALTIDAPRGVFVRGRGLDAEMGGRLQVSGAPAAPSVVGGLTLRRGEFTLGSRRLAFSRGIVTLDNVDAIDPRLDFLATTNVQSTTVGVAITGTSRAPVLAITSTPSLPPDEAMALLIFGKSASSLSAFELVQVAQALAELTGHSPGDSVLGRLRSGLGLDRLSVGSGGAGASGGASGSTNSPVSVEAGRYVAPGVYVGARQGATGTSSRGVVEVDVLDNVKVEGDVGADSNGRVGVKMEWDY